MTGIHGNERAAPQGAAFAVPEVTTSKIVIASPEYPCYVVPVNDTPETTSRVAHV